MLPSQAQEQEVDTKGSATEKGRVSYTRASNTRSRHAQRNLSTVFNCIVDDTTLIQGAKKSTRDGFPRWVSEGRMRVFVPLYTLERVSAVKDKGGNRAASDAGEALEWLDNATSIEPDLVTLQGGYEKFERWSEVDSFAVPKPLFSENDPGAETTSTLVYSFSSFAVQDNVDGTDEKTKLSDRGASKSANVNRKSQDKPRGGRNAKAPDSAAAIEGTPKNLRPLFNYILWRIHQESDPSSALEGFLFLTDNEVLRKQAQRFGIRCKTLSDIRQVIAKEALEGRARRTVRQTVEAAAPRSASRSSNQAPDDGLPAPDPTSDDDEVVFKRAPKVNVMDPDQFLRSPVAAPATAPKTLSPASGLRSGRGGGLRSRGRGGRGRGRGHSPQSSVTIDPESFERPPSSRGGASRGGRGLWTPG